MDQSIDICISSGNHQVAGSGIVLPAASVYKESLSAAMM